MGELRKPFFIAAVVLILIAVASEIGATWFLGGVKANADNVLNDPAFADYKNDISTADLGISIRALRRAVPFPRWRSLTD